ncbi:MULTISPECIES: hypothetical protein [Cupriavidus]|uniref:Uncharacterized protein n=1 Tax=Cupriavidus pauculus TaxID=82633 RepID=A0A3G8H783_9BURK|nr:MULTISPECIES: hypothetical protein [Cupriavidus]AZG16055.1 hypothetical protein EHF44_21775 [Cupriavidus pauculus]MDT6963888.1 hypothetical protein [Cupriavidus sp. SZY C1]
MTAGEIRRPAIGPDSQAGSQPVPGAWAALGEASADVALQEAGEKGHEDYAITDVAALLAEDRDVSPRTRAAVQSLLQRHRLLSEELHRQRLLLQEWILSQLTYKALYYQYSGQKPEAPSIELMREKDMVRRRIRDELYAGADPAALSDDSPRSLSRP